MWHTPPRGRTSMRTQAACPPTMGSNAGHQTSDTPQRIPSSSLCLPRSIDHSSYHLAVARQAGRIDRASRHQLRDRARRAHRDRPSPHVRIKEVDAHTPRALRPERARLPWHAGTYLGAQQQQRQRCAPGTPAWAPRPSPPGLRDSRARDGLRTARLGLLPHPCGVVARGVWPPQPAFTPFYSRTPRPQWQGRLFARSRAGVYFYRARAALTHSPPITFLQSSARRLLRICICTE